MKLCKSTVIISLIFCFTCTIIVPVAMAETLVMDPSFGTNIGFTALDFGNSTLDNALDMIVNPGDIVLTGLTELPEDEGYDCAFAKFNNSSGNTISTSTDDLSPGTGDYHVDNDYVETMKKTGDGNYIAAGPLLLSGNDIFVARYDADFNRVFAWGNDGFVSTDLGGNSDRVHDVEISGDLIYVCGEKDGASSLVDEDIALARYNLDTGSPDIIFGDQGVKILDNQTGSDRAFDMLIHNGIIYVAGGYTVNADNEADFALLRFDMNGDLVESGITSTDFFGLDDYAEVIRLTPGGKILLAGHTYETYGSPQNTKIILAQYNLDGNLDTGFGIDGIVSMDLPSTIGTVPPDPRISDVEFTSEGKILCSIQPHYQSRLILARFDTDGSLDTDFCNGGFLSAYLEDYTNVQIQNIHLLVNNIDVQSDDVVFACGKGQKINGDVDFILGRLVDESTIHQSDDDDDNDDGGGGGGGGNCNGIGSIPLLGIMVLPLLHLMKK